MAIWRFSDIGTRVQATGASDTGLDWDTASNEFPMSECKSVYDNAADGDSLIFKENTTYDVTAALPFNGLSGTEDITFASRTPGARYTWRLTSDVQISFSGGAGTVALSVTDLDVTASVVMTQERFVFLSGGLGDVTFDCRFRNMTVTNANTNTTPAAFDHVSNRAGTKALMIGANSVIFNQNQAAFIRDNSSAGTIAISLNIVECAQTSATTGGTDGWMWYNQANNVEMPSIVFLRNSMAITGANGVLRIGVGHIESSTLTVGTLQAEGNTIDATTAGTATRGFIHSEGVGTIANEIIKDNTIIGPGNHIGLALTSGTTTGTWVIDSCDVSGNAGAYGMAAYGTAGGSVEVKSGKIHGNDWGGTGESPFDIAEGIAIYGGGSGDCIVGAVACYDNTVSGVGNGGVDIYMVHNLVTSPSNAATYTLQNTTCLSGGNAAAVVCQNTQQLATNGDTLTLTIDNVVIGAGGLILLDSAQAGTDSLLNTTIQNSAITVVDRAGHTVSAYTNTDSITFEAGDFNGDGSLIAGSAAIDSGVKYWGSGVRPQGADGEPFPDFGVSIGAYQSQLAPFHPTQL